MFQFRFKFYWSLFLRVHRIHLSTSSTLDVVTSSCAIKVGQEGPCHTPAIPKIPKNVKSIAVKWSHFTTTQHWKRDVDVIVTNIVPHKKKINCIHEWNHITQKKRPHYTCTTRSKNVFRWWQSNAQTVVNLEIFHKRNWYFFSFFLKESIHFIYLWKYSTLNLYIIPEITKVWKSTLGNINYIDL